MFKKLQPVGIHIIMFVRPTSVAIKTFTVLATESIFTHPVRRAVVGTEHRLTRMPGEVLVTTTHLALLAETTT